MPVATCIYQYQPRLTLDRDLADSLTLDERIDFMECCPRKVYSMDIEDKLQITDLQNCIFCDECTAKAKVFGKKELCSVRMDPNMFHFTVEAVTPQGPRSAIDVVRAALRVWDYKMQLFLKDAYGDEITEWL